MPITTALIHQAQVINRSRAAERSAYGEYAETEHAGTPFAARLMIEGDQKKRPQVGSTPSQGDVAERVVSRYEILADTEDEEGNPLTIKATDRIRFIEGGPLGNLTLDVDGKPEMLNNGEEVIGWLAFATLVEDA